MATHEKNIQRWNWVLHNILEQSYSKMFVKSGFSMNTKENGNSIKTSDYVVKLVNLNFFQTENY